MQAICIKYNPNSLYNRGEPNGLPLFFFSEIFEDKKKSSYLCGGNNKIVQSMTALKMKQSSLDLISQIDDKDTKLLEKVWIFLSSNVKSHSRQGWEAAAQLAHQNGDDKLLANDVFEDVLSQMFC